MARRDGDTAEDSAMNAQAGFSGVAVAERPSENGVADASEAPTQRKRTPKQHSDDPNELFGVTIRVPQALKDQLDETAKTQDISTPQLVIRMLADAYEYTLPDAAKKSRRVQKYASVEERKQAQRDAQQAQRNRVKALLAAVDEGKIDIDIDALVAEMAARQAAAKQQQAQEQTETQTATVGAAS